MYSKPFTWELVLFIIFIVVNLVWPRTCHLVAHIFKWDEAEKLEMDVMNARETTLGSDHPSTLTSIINLVSTYRNQGRWDEAKKLQINVMNRRKTKLGSDHPDTFASMSSLETMCRNEGELNELEKLQSEVINAKSRPESGHLDAILPSITNQPETMVNSKPS